MSYRWQPQLEGVAWLVAAGPILPAATRADMLALLASATARQISLGESAPEICLRAGSRPGRITFDLPLSGRRPRCPGAGRGACSEPR
jgi:hypothetical protein